MSFSKDICYGKAEVAVIGKAAMSESAPLRNINYFADNLLALLFRENHRQCHRFGEHISLIPPFLSSPPTCSSTAPS